MMNGTTCRCGCGQASCDCCAGIEPLTPRPTANRPGLDAIAYRIGTHGSFLETMKARLSLHRFDDDESRRPLAGLATRDAGDAAIALLDAWATVADVLTFYQERIANEGYLRTAAELRSVYELAKLIGYRPKPGVAASVYLAYAIDGNTKEEVVIPRGTRAQSVPGPGELPQSFETGEDLQALARWNLLKPRMTKPQEFDEIVDRGRLYLKGIATGLKAGDPLLIDPVPGEPKLYRVTAAVPDADADRTAVDFQEWNQGILTREEVQSVRAVMDGLKQALPKSKGASDFAHVLDGLVETAGKVPTRGELIGLIEALLRTFRGIGADSDAQIKGKLRRWISTAEGELRLLAEAMRADDAVSGDSVTSPADLAARLGALIKRRSEPLANSKQLPRSLRALTSSTGDAGLKLTGTFSQDLRENLGAAIAGYERAAPAQTLEVYALRVKAGLFGRTFPRRQRTVRGPDAAKDEVTYTEPVGEWPIVENAEFDENANLLRVTATEYDSAVFLDASYDGILQESWLVIDTGAVPVFEDSEVMVEPSSREDPSSREAVLIARVNSVRNKLARAEYGGSGETTCVSLDRKWIRFVIESPDDFRTKRASQSVIDNDFRVIRSSAVYAVSEKLELAEAPIDDDVCGGDVAIELDGLYKDLEPGRFVVVTGERTDIEQTAGVAGTEPVMIAEVVHDVRAAGAQGLPWTTAAELASAEQRDAPGRLPGDRIHTFVRFHKPLQYCYRRDSVALHGNVVKATHGETHEETLGGGNAKPLQTFGLKQFPLTFLAAPTAVGSASTLELFVDDVRWRERESFIEVLATDRVFVTKTGGEGKTSVIFGTGLEGARPPSGTENVKALYRSGIGGVGNVRQGTITQLSTRPLGVKEVTNPLRASGGADREGRDRARRNAPVAVMSLDRLVSTRDYADFARSFAGIGKAAAMELSDGLDSIVHVTVAGADDAPIDADSDLFLNLRRALRELGDPFQPVQLAARELLVLVMSAGIRIHPDHRWETVVAELRARLLAALGFERRELGQSVTSSEVLSLMQSIPGVVYVDLDSFGAVPATTADPQAAGGRRPLTPPEIAAAVANVIFVPPAARVAVKLAAREPGTTVVRPAQLVLLQPDVAATLILNQLK